MMIQNGRKNFLSYLAGITIGGLGLLASASPMWGAIVTNGDFESGTSTGWTNVIFSQFDPSVVATTNVGWGNKAIKLNRDNNNYANSPGITQTIDVGNTVSTFRISFDVQNASGSKVIFRIRTEDGTQYWNGSAWVSLTLISRTKNFQRDWGTDASSGSGGTSYDRLSANSLIVATDGISSSNMTITPISGITKYVIEFYNPIKNTTSYLDNIIVAVPEPAAVGVLTTGFLVGSACVKRIKR